MVSFLTLETWSKSGQPFQKNKILDYIEISFTSDSDTMVLDFHVVSINFCNGLFEKLSLEKPVFFETDQLAFLSPALMNVLVSCQVTIKVCTLILIFHPLLERVLKTRPVPRVILSISC